MAVKIGLNRRPFSQGFFAARSIFFLFSGGDHASHTATVYFSQRICNLFPRKNRCVQFARVNCEIADCDRNSSLGVFVRTLWCAGNCRSGSGRRKPNQRTIESVHGTFRRGVSGLPKAQCESCNVFLSETHQNV